MGPWDARDASPNVDAQPEWSQILGTHEHGDACADLDCLPSLMICATCPTVDDCRSARLCAQPWRLIRATPDETRARLGEIIARIVTEDAGLLKRLKDL
jgi:hypothetical protein